jgi:hypothetical protein
MLFTNWMGSYRYRREVNRQRYLNTLAINSRMFKSVNRFVSRLFAHISSRRSSNFEHFSSVWCIVCLRASHEHREDSAAFILWRYSLNSILFVRAWTMIALSDRVILLNFLRTFSMSFLMIRWMILSVMMILHVSIHSIFARVRISLLIAEMNTLELTMTKVSESRSDCLHSVIFLTVMSIASLSRTSTWTRIQWMWISRSHCSILRINVCSKYWSNCFLKHWIARIAA